MPNSEQSLELLKELALKERLPLLSLLQARPLKVQTAHLSFQEFYAASAVCDGVKLPTPPWEVPVFWTNAVRLGLDMGDAFGRGFRAQCVARTVPRRVHAPWAHH